MLIDNIKLDDIYQFIETGNPDNAPEEIVAYLEILTRIHGMIQRIDKYGSRKGVIAHLIIAEKMSHYKASQLYNEAFEYFFVEPDISKRAWANFYATMIDEEINYARQTKKDSSDSKRIVDMIKTAGEFRDIFTAEKEEIPEEMFPKQIVVYTTDISDLGLEKVDRNKLKEWIDKKAPSMTERERDRIYQEADIIPFKALLNEQENPRKV